MASIVGMVRIRDQYTQECLMSFACDQIVGGVRACDGEAMSNQWLQVKFTIAEKLQESFHVASFGPAHVANGIVDPLLLVC